MGYSKSYKKRLAAKEAFNRMHSEPDADERGGPSDNDADNKKKLLRPKKLPAGQRMIAD